MWDAHLPLAEKSIKSACEGGSDVTEEKTMSKTIKLYRCTEEEGTLKVSEVKSGPLLKADLDSTVSILRSAIFFLHVPNTVICLFRKKKVEQL